MSIGSPQFADAAVQSRWLAGYGNNRSLAYRAFLANHVNQRVDPRHYMIDRRHVIFPPAEALYQRQRQTRPR